MTEIILASKSPRRRELLGGLFKSFRIETREVEESLDPDIHPRRGVELLAVRKGQGVSEAYPEALVISSDTLVELDGVPLGKPCDGDDARRMLRSLSGRTHNVHTGVAVHYRGHVFSGVDTTGVSFRELTDEEIGDYLASGEPMDKAGAYGIQGLGGKFVLGINGAFDTVVGLSMKLTASLVNQALGGKFNEEK